MPQGIAIWVIFDRIDRELGNRAHSRKSGDPKEDRRNSKAIDVVHDDVAFDQGEVALLRLLIDELPRARHVVLLCRVVVSVDICVGAKQGPEIFVCDLSLGDEHAEVVYVPSNVLVDEPCCCVEPLEQIFVPRFACLLQASEFGFE